jgi:hypothetical protein
MNGMNADGGVAPTTVNCTPGQSFCTGTHLATCTLSGADAVLGDDCAAQGSATNPASCATTGCPAGQAACCRRQNPLSTWSFSQPAESGQAYLTNTTAGNVWISVGTTCVGSGLKLQSADLIRSLSTCPSNAFNVLAEFDRTMISSGTSYPLPTTGITFAATVGTVSCYQWSGTIEITADLPNWSLNINATCTTASTTLSIIGTMGGSQ